MRILNTLFLLLLINPFIWAQRVPEKPVPARLVNDFTGTFNENQKNQLEQNLVDFAAKTSTQIVLVVVPDLSGMDKSQYAIELGQKWGVGQKGKDNGIVLLIKPKTERSKGEVFIATGYGLEGVIPDVVAKRITENEMIPLLKQDDYFNAVLAALSTMQKLSLQEFAASEYMAKTAKKKKGNGRLGLIPLLIFFFIIYSLFNRKRQHSVGGKTSGLSFLAQMMLLSSIGRHGGAYRDFSSGSGGFGGGGGFGGFGGGGFGGGGAGGSW